MALEPTTLVGWWTLEAAAGAWPDVQGAPEDLEELRRVLAVGHEIVLIYGPVDASGATITVDTPLDAIPDRVRTAQLLQAKAQWAAERAGVGDLIGPDGHTVRVYPMDWQVKNLCRPDDGVPVIG